MGVFEKRLEDNDLWTRGSQAFWEEEEKRRAGAATGLSLPRCAVLARPGQFGEEKPRLAGDYLEEPLLHHLLF